ncbi:MAG TPA: hypothetical protein VIL20_15430 [Sandaracinaceae bacterium]
MPRSLFAVLSFLALVALGCGSALPPISAARGGDDEEEREDDEAEDEGADEGGDGFVDEAALRESGAPVELGEPTDVPGTGVTMRPPEGATPIPFGAGFLSMRHRVQISVVVAEGPASLLDAVRGQAAGAEPYGEVEEVTIAGQTGRIGRDRVRAQQAELERAWLLVHDGERGLAITATYEASRSRRIFPAMRESFASVTWNREVDLDPALALGLEVGRVEGFTPSRATTANVVLLGQGASFPPQPGQPVVTISPLPMQLASDQTARVCEQIIARMLPVPTSDIAHEGAIEDGPLPGCERLATAEADGMRLATYAALVFIDRTPILVTGSARADQLERYRARFAAAARAIRPRS